MGSKRFGHSGGSATGKATDMTPKKGAGHKIESPRNGDDRPVKAGRNMGGRDLLGDRVRTQRKKGNA